MTAGSSELCHGRKKARKKNNEHNMSIFFLQTLNADIFHKTAMFKTLGWHSMKSCMVHDGILIYYNGLVQSLYYITGSCNSPKKQLEENPRFWSHWRGIMIFTLLCFFFLLKVPSDLWIWGFRGDVRADDGLGCGCCRTGIFWGDLWVFFWPERWNTSGKHLDMISIYVCIYIYT